MIIKALAPLWRWPLALLALATRQMLARWRLLLVGGLIMGLGGIQVLSSAYLYLAPNLPDVDELRDVKLQVPLRVYTRDGLFLGEFGTQRRIPVAYEEVPPTFIQALLAAEDDSFYEHPGINIKSLLRAVVEMLSSGGEIRSGGSTITMQVAKNYLLTTDRTVARKLNEILLSLQMERELSKKEILALYLNKIYLGNRAYGVAAAAQVYYGTTIDRLDLAQWAMIAGLPKAPSLYNPIVNPERSDERRDWILGRMLKLGHIDRQTHDTAILEPVTARRHGPILRVDAPYAAEMVRSEMFERFGQGVYEDGYVVYTTIDSSLQQKADQALRQGLLDYDRRHGRRAPEGHVSSPDSQQNIEDWLARLAEEKAIGSLLPAFVNRVGEDQASVMFKDGETAIIEWENGIRQGRRYLDPDSRGPIPQSAHEVLQEGDLVRVYKDPQNASLQLSQVPEVQGALVAMDPKDGAIRALSGGFDYAHSQFNRATQAYRQTGSVFKPFIYALALEHGFTAASIINDAPVVLRAEEMETFWRPVNAEKEFLGPMRLRVGLYKSRNLVSVRLLQNIGIETALEYLPKFGFDPATLPRDLSLSLGSYAATPLEVATAYASLANGGWRVYPYLISQVNDVDGQILYMANPPQACPQCLTAPVMDSAMAADDALPAPALTSMQRSPTNAGSPSLPMPEDQEGPSSDLRTTESTREPSSEMVVAERILEPRIAYIVKDMMRDVIRQGTGRNARELGRDDLAGKTGTTNGPTDAWFSAFHDQLVTTVWLGFDDNRLLGRSEYGGLAALPVWVNFMRHALAEVPPTTPVLPEGISMVRIDPVTGLLAGHLS